MLFPGRGPLTGLQRPPPRVLYSRIASAKLNPRFTCSPSRAGCWPECVFGFLPPPRLPSFRYSGSPPRDQILALLLTSLVTSSKFFLLPGAYCPHLYSGVPSHSDATGSQSLGPESNHFASLVCRPMSFQRHIPVTSPYPVPKLHWNG